MDIFFTSSSGSTITEKPSVEKDLGVIMSNNGTFKKHIEEVVREARSQAAWVLRTFSTRDKIPMTTLFKALVQCKLDYCSQLWSPTAKGEINALEMVQRSFLRKIKNVGHLPYWEQLKELKLYSQERRRERYMIIYIWRILEGQVPNIGSPNCRGHIREKINSRPNCHENDRLGRRCDIPKPLPRTHAHIQNLREASLCVRGARLFNLLPKSIRDMRDCSTEAFKRALDKHLKIIPDEPQIQGYTACRRAESNSLLNMSRLAYSETDVARVEVAVASRGCAPMLPWN